MSKNAWGYWDCPSCGTKALRGDKRECPNCGHTRDENTKFYMIDDKLEYVDKDNQNNNADWICAYCNTLNKYNLDNCESCGAAKDEQKGDYFSNKVNSAESSSVHNNDTQQPLLDTDDKLYKQISKQKKQLNRGLIFKLVGVVALVICLICAIVFICTPKVESGKVVATLWERTINLEELRTFNESDWYLPSGARLQYSRQEYKETISVLDHYETRHKSEKRTRVVGQKSEISGYKDLGNGQFEEETRMVNVTETYYEDVEYEVPIYRDEAVYAEKYYYEIDRWVDLRSVVTSGVDKSPEWGTYTLYGDKQREGSRKEVLEISVHLEKGDNKSWELNRDTWDKINVGDYVTVSYNRLTKKVKEIRVNDDLIYSDK